MSRLFFITAFLLGAAAVLWMMAIFSGSDTLALSVTAVIGAVYMVGFIELIKYRQVTATLAKALLATSSKVVDLGNWLRTLHPSLQNCVRVRIEGERVGLPAPVLTPYLVGLLVMLGLLGTFMGMVDTLKGAVIALEGSTDLATIRAGLAAPINGLGFAFGTSVAGVSASAMLGLMSTLSRRDRMLATTSLDSKIGTHLRDFSLLHQRQQTFSAFQDQAQLQTQTLPEVAEKLHAMADKLEQMGDKLGDRFVSAQQMFHESAKNIYTELASSVGQTLKQCMAESSRLAGESIKPIVSHAMQDISREAKNTHQHLTDTAQQQFDALSGSFTQTSAAVTGAWQQGIAEHERANDKLVNGMHDSLHGFSTEFERLAASLLTRFDQTSVSWLEQQRSEDSDRLQRWADCFDRSQQQANTQLSELSQCFAGEFKQAGALHNTALTTVTQEFETMASLLTKQWLQVGQQADLQQQQITAALAATARDMNADALSNSELISSKISSLLEFSEKLLESRAGSEQAWLERHSESMHELTAALQGQLSALRKDESQRGNAAVARLAELETAVVAHLATLGNALEAPMTRLIETASQTPKAAAEVIGHLRRELANNMERDNSLLEERSAIMAQLNGLADVMTQTSAGQQTAIETLVASSATMLQQVGTQFTEQIDSELSNLSEMSDNVSGSAVEISSLGEAFRHAVELFAASNKDVIENLARIEAAMDKSTLRSDEQLAYYIAQAREIIDHSLLSQQQIFDQLAQRNTPDSAVAVELS